MQSVSSQEFIQGNEQPQLSSPHEELAFLRERLAQLEAHIQPVHNAQEQRQQLAHELVQAYHETPGVQVLDQSHMIPQQETHEITLNLQPEQHDVQMEELYSLMMERGIKMH